MVRRKLPSLWYSIGNTDECDSGQRKEVHLERSASETEVVQPEEDGVVSVREAPIVEKRLSRLHGPRKDYLLSVLIPVYNEVNTLVEILERVRDVEIKKEILLVDDGSTDGTRELMRDE